jgi:hypothetical protein
MFWNRTARHEKGQPTRACYWLVGPGNLLVLPRHQC